MNSVLFNVWNFFEILLTEFKLYTLINTLLMTLQMICFYFSVKMNALKDKNRTVRIMYNIYTILIMKYYFGVKPIRNNNRITI